jgi:hypothetical protein
MASELVGIIGGTGLGDALAPQLTAVEMREVDTPFGKPSGPIMLGTLGNRRIAFLNRHGEGHKLSPSEVPFANIFALKKTRARRHRQRRRRIAQTKIAPRPGADHIDKTWAHEHLSGYGAALRDGPARSAGPRDDGTRRHPARCHGPSQRDLAAWRGPSSPPKPSRSHRKWGGDLIGDRHA